jgi:hypothetical protein
VREGWREGEGLRRGWGGGGVGVCGCECVLACSRRIVVAKRSSSFENPSVRVRAAVMRAMMIIALSIG